MGITKLQLLELIDALPNNTIFRAAVKREGRRQGEEGYVDTFEVALEVPDLNRTSPDGSFNTETITYVAPFTRDMAPVLIFGCGKTDNK